MLQKCKNVIFWAAKIKQTILNVANYTETLIPLAQDVSVSVFNISSVSRLWSGATRQNLGCLEWQNGGMWRADQETAEYVRNWW